METICIKMEDELFRKMNKDMKAQGYTTKAEFIREAIRKKLEEDEREFLIKKFMKFKGKAKTKTSDEELRKIREQALVQLAKEKGWEL
jgi:metal-responsive CopG/Arc/MetJ family transcriptional regulator